MPKYLLFVHKYFFLVIQRHRFGTRATALVALVRIICALVHLLDEQVQVIGAQVLSFVHEYFYLCMGTLLCAQLLVLSRQALLLVAQILRLGTQLGVLGALSPRTSNWYHRRLVWVRWGKVLWIQSLEITNKCAKTCILFLKGNWVFPRTFSAVFDRPVFFARLKSLV